MKTFSKDGNSYSIVPVENSNTFAVIKNNRNVKYTEDSRLYDLCDLDEYQNKIIKLF